MSILDQLKDPKLQDLVLKALKNERKKALRRMGYEDYAGRGAFTDEDYQSLADLLIASPGSYRQLSEAIGKTDAGAPKENGA